MFQGDIPQYYTYNVFLKVYQFLMHYPMLVTYFIDPLILNSKLNIIKKDIKEKAVNWLKLITKQVQAQIMKDLWY